MAGQTSVTCGAQCRAVHRVQRKQHLSIGAEGGVREGEGALGTAVWGAAVSGGLGGSVRGGGAAVSAAWAEGAGGEGGGGPSTCGIISMSTGGPPSL